jgi:putative phosphoribosyl transferase
VAVDQERFADRHEAGRALGDRLAERPRDGAVVLGLPRGGVVVAAEVAAVLHLPLDVLVVRKLGVPRQPELAMGAVATAGDAVETVRLGDVVAGAHVTGEVFEQVRQVQVRELLRRQAALRAGRPAPPLRGRPVLLVDDGLATGATMRAAVAAVRAAGVAAVTVAVPVGSPRAAEGLRPAVDELVCLRCPRWFRSVGQLYRDFAETGDDEVRAALRTGQ